MTTTTTTTPVQAAAPALEYYTARDSADRRPAAVTAVAVVGIVIAGLLILMQALGVWGGVFQTPPPAATSWRGRSMLIAAPNTTAVAGYLAGALLGNACALLMLMGCCGLLALRPTARRLTFTVACAWLGLGVISLVVLYGQSNAPATPGFPTRPPQTAARYLSSATVVLLAQICFPVAAILVLRQPKVAALHARRPSRPQVILRLLKPVAIAALAFASVWTIEGCTMLSRFADDKPDRLIFLYKLFPNSPTFLGHTRASNVFGTGREGVSGWVIIDALIYTVLNAAIATGAVLVLLRNRDGGRLIIGCALAVLTFTITQWGIGGTEPSPIDRLYVMMGASPAGVRNVPTFSNYLNLLTSRVGLLFWPILLLIIFTHRPLDPAPR